MCQNCPEEHERATSKYGATVVAIQHDPIHNTLIWNIQTGKAEVVVTLPVGPDMRDHVECATFIGEHLAGMLAAAAQAFMAKLTLATADQGIADLEKMLRDTPE